MPTYRAMSAGQAENRPGHKPLSSYDLPSWLEHPLKQQSQKVAIIFPGEYNQYPGMLAGCRDMPVVRDMVEMASECFELDVESLMSRGAMDLMSRPDYAQILVYVANCAAYEVLKREQPAVAEYPQCVAGFSVGEYSALVAAGVMTYDQGLIIVKARAEAMKRWSAQHDMDALGVFGVEQDELERLCLDATRQDAEAGELDPQVHISHFWGQGGYVAAGRRRTVAALRELAGAREGAFLHPLEHHHEASHTPLCAPVAAEVERAVRTIPLEPPRCEVYFNHGYRVAAGSEPDTFVDYLLKQLTTPVRWDGIVSTCLQRGVRHFVECGPGESLRDLMLFNATADVHGELRPYEFTTNLKV